METACLLGKRKHYILNKVKSIDCMVKTHLSGPVDSEFEAAADNIKTEANKPMEHAFTERGTLSNKWMNSDTLNYLLR